MYKAFCHRCLCFGRINREFNMLYYIRGRPQRTAALFRWGGGTQLQTFVDSRGGGVSGMQTSAFFKNDQDKFLSKNSKCFTICAYKKRNIPYKLWLLSPFPLLLSRDHLVVLPSLLVFPWHD